jgi:hypothetical protein
MRLQGVEKVAKIEICCDRNVSDMFLDAMKRTLPWYIVIGVCRLVNGKNAGIVSYDVFFNSGLESQRICCVRNTHQVPSER